MSKTKRQKLLPDYTYHIFNRGINGQMIFFQEKNYNFFLKRYAAYTKQYIDTYAYCLLPNHFHFLVTIRSTSVILQAAAAANHTLPKALQKELLLKNLCQPQDVPDFENLAHLSALSNPTHKQRLLQEEVATWVVSDQFRKCFSSYAKAINNQENRHGSLFEKPFKRKLVDQQEYLHWLVWYIHRNPVHHKICQNYASYSRSSFQSFLSPLPTLLKRQQVFEYFDSKKEFLAFHEQAASDWEGLDDYIIE